MVVSETPEQAPQKVRGSASSRVSKNRLDKHLMGVAQDSFTPSLCGQEAPNALFRALSVLSPEVYQAARGLDPSLSRKQYHLIRETSFGVEKESEKNTSS